LYLSQVLSNSRKKMTNRPNYEDIKKENQDLKRQIGNFQTFCQNFSDIIYRLDEEGKILYVNAAVKRYGYTADELIGRNMLDFIHPMDQEKACKRITERKERIRDDSEPLEVRLVTKENSYVEFEAKAGSILEPIVSVEAEGIYDGNADSKKYLGHQGVLRDLSETKRLEKTLRDELTTNNALLKGLGKAGINIDIVSRDYNVLYQTDGLEKIFGEVNNRLCHKTYMDQDKPCGHCAMEKALQTGQVQSVELTGKDERNYRISSVPHANHSGKVDQVIEIIEDITEVKLSQKRFQDLIENIDEVYYTLDLDGNITHISSVIKNVLGYDPQEITGKLSSKFIHKDDILNTRLEFEAAKKGKLDPIEYRLITKDGKTIWIQTYLRPIIENRKVIGLQGILSDITERKLANDKLTREKAFTDEIINSLPGIFYVYDEDGKLIRWNKNHELKTGYSASELLNKKAKFFYDDKENEKLKKALGKILGSGGTTSIDTELNLKNKDGTKTPYLFTCRIVVIDNKKYLAGMGLDLTQRKEEEKEKKNLKEQLFQTQKLEAIGTLAAGVAHDFNNILSAIFGFVQLSKKKLPISFEYQQITGYLDKVLLAGTRAKDLVDQILAFSRKAGNEPKNLDLTPILNDSITFLRATIPTTVNINHTIDPKLSKVYADPVQIHQIIMNLCTNALHAMDNDRGTLDVDLSNCKLWFRSSESGYLDPGDYVTLTVSDTGVGMDEKTRKRIFDPFFTTKEKGKGTGLGLSVVHGIVKKHGGAIFVYSRPGQGTKFQIYLPVSSRDSVDVAKEEETELPMGSESILLIDDEVDISTAYGEMLKMQGYTVKTFTSSRDALDEFAKTPDNFDLIFTDLTMPKMNGIELSREIHKIKQNIPIILISGLAELVPEEELKSAGIAIRHSKPVELVTLLKGVRSVLDNPYPQ